MNPFKSRGFDTLISKGSRVEGKLFIAANETAQIDGSLISDEVVLAVPESSRPDGNAPYMKTRLNVNGLVNVAGRLDIPNVTVTGELHCSELRVEGVLAIKTGAVVKAEKILYRTIVMEQGAIVSGNMLHLDHVSEGERT